MGQKASKTPFSFSGKKRPLNSYIYILIIIIIIIIIIKERKEVGIYELWLVNQPPGAPSSHCHTGFRGLLEPHGIVLKCELLKS
jgi:hypothetical protein